MHTDDEGMREIVMGRMVQFYFFWEEQLGPLAPETTRARCDGISFRNTTSLMLR